MALDRVNEWNVDVISLGVTLVSLHTVVHGQVHSTHLTVIFGNVSLSVLSFIAHVPLETFVTLQLLALSLVPRKRTEQY